MTVDNHPQSDSLTSSLLWTAGAILLVGMVALLMT